MPCRLRVCPIRPDAHRPAVWERPVPPPGPRGPRGQENPRHGHRPLALSDAHRQDDQAVPHGRGIQGQGQWCPLPPAHHPSAQRGTADLHGQRLALGPALARGILVPCPPWLADGLLVTLQAVGAYRTACGQGTRARPHPAAPPPCQHRGLGRAQRRQVWPTRRQPVVEPGLATQG